jgi:hypothetical protein
MLAVFILCKWETYISDVAYDFNGYIAIFIKLGILHELHLTYYI